MVIELNKASFTEYIGHGIVIIDFGASWCGPCKILGPTVEAVAAEDDSIKVAKVNVDDNPDLSDMYKIMSIPTLLFFKDGELKDTSVGVVSKQLIQNMISSLK